MYNFGYGSRTCGMLHLLLHTNKDFNTNTQENTFGKNECLRDDNLVKENTRVSAQYWPRE